MKFLILLLVFLAVAIGLALLSLDDPGYILISRAPHEIEISLVLFLLILFLTFAALYVILRIISHIMRAPKNVKKWHKRKSVERAQVDTLKGYAGLIEGNWDNAERDLVKRLKHTPTPMLNYLGAAYAAQQRGDATKRDFYLSEANANDPRNELAVNLTQARLQFQMGEFGDARKSAEKLLEQAPRNIPVLRLLADIYRELGDWQALIDILPKIQKSNAFSMDELRQREIEAHQKQADSPALQHDDGAKLLGKFYTMPSAQKNDPDILAVYARQMIQTGQMNQCEELLRRSIKKQWHGELVYLYGLVESSHLDEQYEFAKKLLAQHEEDADILLTMARLSARKERWDDTRDFLEQAIEHGGRDEAYAELGALLESQGDSEDALEVYREGIKSLVKSPLPKAVTPASQQLVLAGESRAVEAVDYSTENQDTELTSELVEAAPEGKNS